MAGELSAEQRQAAYAGLDAAVAALVETRGLRDDVAEFATRDRRDYEGRAWKRFAIALEKARAVLRVAGPSKKTVVAAKNGLLDAAGGLTTISRGGLETIQNNTFWKDTDGNPIYSQGGGVFRFGDTYYWYGVQYTGAVKYYSNPTNPNSDTAFQAITVYSSQDLVHWKFENNVATPATAVHIPTSKDVTEDWFSRMDTLADTSWLGRLGVTYNENTGKYTIISQTGTRFGSGPTAGGDIFLQSDSPTGDFRYANIQAGFEGTGYQSTGDQTVFTDDDGSDYLVFSNPSGRANAYVAKISDADSLSVGPATRIGYVPAGREGNAMFKADGHYYVASSDLHGWNASTTHIIRSAGTDITGPYSADAVLDGSQQDYSHVTQSGFFINVTGTEQDTVLYAGDRWSDFAWNGLGYNDWVPITVNLDGTTHFNSLSQWKLNATSGKWAVGEGNNYVLNPDFAADRASVPTITGWAASADPGTTNTDFVTNSLPGADETRWSGKLRSATAFSGALSQTVAVPAGTYRFALKSLLTGQLDHARAHITGAPGEDYTLDLNAPTATWTDHGLESLQLTGGEVSIRIEAGGTGSANSICVDALSLMRTTD
ncbi:family 43 glycosylhydrolase [Kineosporia mesophila]|uniref:Family 43 glycosylhydrolase n=1 Tax=Kineosporia mesophila TaxID=566012 RepID=A0ABP6ZMB4_9ACTN|nr:family 43 glycosylhydrolase [Kineosporia mesophila]MCD5353689.1 family 43 glycosylhydrolase [Kineosporia mesophila]